MVLTPQLTVVLLLALGAYHSASAAEQSTSASHALRFDPGPADSLVDEQSVELTRESLYTPGVGFGWTHPPRHDFFRRDLSRSRQAMTIDGVAGDRLQFRADVAPGPWRVTLWLETGLSEQHWPQILVQGRRQVLSWQSFQPAAEPRTKRDKLYRVFQCVTVAESNGLSIDLLGQPDQVRLLGLSLLRESETTTPRQRQHLRQLESVGGHNSGLSPGDLLRQVQQSASEDAADVLPASWHTRLELLVQAERYYKMRGWQWADQETGLGMFDRQQQAVMLLDGLLMADPRATEPLTERALHLRGQLLFWLGKETGGAREIAQGKRDLELLAERHPDDQLLAMYTGRQIDLPDPCDCLESTSPAPDWSIAQREALCRLRQIAHWWVEERQSDTGEFGGKFGDDVELLRWWAPLCLAGDETALRGWQKLADGVWQSKHVLAGYARQLADVEHAAEFVADTAPAMVIYHNAPRYAERLRCSSQHFESLWTGLTPSHNRFFRSAWFSATAVETAEPKGRDLEYNTRAVQAMRYLARRHPDPKLVSLLHEWSLAWVHAALRTDKGKPSGIVPASVRFVDEAINGDGPNWYQANMYWDYYEWEHYAGSLMLDQLLFTHTLTGDERLLQPMFMALELIQSHESNLSADAIDSLEDGSPAWAASQLVSCRPFWNVVEQWRFLTGDPRWDALILRHGSAYGRYRISGDQHNLVEGLRYLLEHVRYNTPLQTSAAIYTDRVQVPGWECLKAMLTGDGIHNNLSPYHRVSWQQTDENFTALVTETSRDRLEIEVFSHAQEDYQCTMRFWQMPPGNYRLIRAAPGIPLQEDTVRIDLPGQQFPLTVPGQQLLKVSLRRIP